MKTFLKLGSPSFTCGDCWFTSTLNGHWTIEHGRLVFRADADPQPRRGPDLSGCCENRECVRFDRIIADTGQEFSFDYIVELRGYRDNVDL